MAQTENTKLPTPVMTPVGEIITNDKNPRYIKSERFDKLVQSIKDFPEMLQYRPVVVNKHQIIIGGNRRYQAALKLGWDRVPVLDASKLTDAQVREFIIKDNVSAGEWDDELLDDWDENELDDWGLDRWKPEDVDVDEFFEDAKEEESGKESKHLIVFTFNDDSTYEQVKARLSELGDNKEEVLLKLLEL